MSKRSLVYKYYPLRENTVRLRQDLVCPLIDVVDPLSITRASVADPNLCPSPRLLHALN